MLLEPLMQIGYHMLGHHLVHLRRGARHCNQRATLVLYQQARSSPYWVVQQSAATGHLALSKVIAASLPVALGEEIAQLLLGCRHRLQCAIGDLGDCLPGQVVGSRP